MLRSVGRWKKDSEATSCEDCGASFGFLKRRHHCRSCGGIFCGACTEHTVQLLLVSATQPQRACGPCCQRLRPPVRVPPTPAQRPTVGPAAKAVTVAPASVPRQQPPEKRSVPQGHPDSKEGQTDSETTRRNTDGPSGPDTTGGPHLDRPEDDEGDEEASSSDDGMEPPRLDLSSLPVSIAPQSSHSLSFLSTLQDSLKERDADNIISVLIYAGEGKEQTMVTDVRAGETMRMLADRLAPLYGKMLYPPFRRITDADVEALQATLCFYTEHQRVEPCSMADDVARHCKKLVLSTLQFPALVQLFHSAASGHSVRSFLRSAEQSERAIEAALGSERFDD